MMILRNSATCNHCKDELESKHRHDFVTCSCGKLSLDGGKDYGRTLFETIGGYTDTSIVDDDSHELRRKYLKWGNNYDKDMNKLPETVYNPIMDMSTDHIEAILDGGWVSKNPFYEDMFKEELKFRIKDSV